MKKNLFVLAATFSFSSRSKAKVILEEGACKHGEVELAKALSTTAAFKQDSELRGAVLTILENASVPKKTTERKSESRKSAEPERRRY